MTFQPGANVYTQGFGSRPENVEVPHLDMRDPTPNDILFPIGKRWTNTIGNSEWVLTSQSTIGNVTTSTWVPLGSGQQVGFFSYLSSTNIDYTSGTDFTYGTGTGSTYVTTYNVGSSFSGGTFTAPIKDVYSFTGYIAWEFFPMGVSYAAGEANLLVNGVETLTGAQFNNIINDNSIQSYLIASVTGQVLLNAGDTCGLQGFLTFGAQDPASLFIGGGTTPYLTTFGGSRQRVYSA